MSTFEIGQKLVELCRAGKSAECVETLYSEDIVSVEAAPPPAGGDRVMKGLDAIRGKQQWWAENHEIHESSVEGPWPHGDDRFAVRFTFDITNKPMNARMKMDEIAVFHVDSGKIVREEFFYTMGK